MENLATALSIIELAVSYLFAAFAIFSHRFSCCGVISSSRTTTSATPASTRTRKVFFIHSPDIYIKAWLDDIILDLIQGYNHRLDCSRRDIVEL